MLETPIQVALVLAALVAVLWWLTADRDQRGEADDYGSNCNVKLTALHRLKPSSNAKSHEGSITAWLRSSLQSTADAYVRSRRGAMNPHTTRTMIAPTIAPMKPAFSPG